MGREENYFFVTALEREHFVNEVSCHSASNNVASTNEQLAQVPPVLLALVWV